MQLKKVTHSMNDNADVMFVCVFFERYLQTKKGGDHSHIQCIPVDLDSGSAI